MILVRSTVTANPITAAYLAGHEIATANLEQLVFDNIPNVRDVKPGSINPSDGMAAHLVASDPDKRVGTAILLKVMPGDKFSLSAKTYYEGDYNETEETGSGPVLESLLSALMGGNTYAGAPVSELPENIQTIQGIFANPALASRVADLQSIYDVGTAPKAHLNYLFFNDNFELQTEQSGSLQVQPNGTGWGLIDNVNICNCTGTGTVPARPGFILVYVDNQSIGKDVWFDDIHIEHYTSSILEENHYYPFGLAVGVGQAGQPNLPNQPYKYNGKELNKELGIEMYSYGNREYDPQLGRFNSMDRFAEKYYSMAPYQYGANNPVLNIDINGDSIQVTTSSGQSLYYAKGNNGYGFYFNTKSIDKENGLETTSQNYYSGDDQYVKDVDQALGKIGLTKEGGEMIDFLSSSRRAVTIGEGDKNEFTTNGKGGAVSWKQSNVSIIPTEKGVTSNVPFISLAHELAHSEDHFKGTLKSDKTWRGNYANYPEGEKYATHRENQIRSSSGLPLRTHYGSVILPGTDTYTPDERSRIIKSNGQSIYYPGINYKKK